MAGSGLGLGAPERRAYCEDGFFLRPRAFAEEELRPLREAVECIDAKLGRETGASAARDRAYAIDGNRYVETAGATVQIEHHPEAEALRVVEPFHHLDSRLDALVDDPRIVEPMRDLVGCEAVALFTSKLNLKRPQQGSAFRWHQDSPYWAHICAHLDRLPNVMVALDDADEDNGCLRVVRGSHRRGMLPGLCGQGRLGALFTDPRHFDESSQVPAAMPAGSLLFFSPHTVHGSRPNRSGRPRRAMVLTYQPAGHPLFTRPDQIRNARPR